MNSMSTTQKRYLMGSLGFHGFLFFVLVFGSAFFVSRQPVRDYAMLKVIPSRFVEGLSGGGGNPNIPVSNEQKKGDPNAETEAKPKPTPVKPPEPKPEPPPVQKVETKPEPVKPEPVKPPVTKPKETFDLKPTV